MAIDSIGASTPILLYKRASLKNGSRSCKRRLEGCMSEINLQNLMRVIKKRGIFFPCSAIKSVAMELTTKEARPEEDKGVQSSRLWPPANKADNPSLHNPLQRQERLGCGWLGIILEWEGVIVEDDAALEKQAWLVLAQEEGKSPPPAFVLRRIEGMKNEQALSEVLCWSRHPSQLHRLASRKEEIHQNLHGGFYQIRTGSQEFVSTLISHRIPIAVASTRPRRVLEEAMKAVGLQNLLDVIVAAEDVYRGKPDPEMFVCVAQLLNFIPERCIVVGNSNSSVEAAHDARMKCVAVASKHPLYELGAADLVVRRLDELSIVDLKNLAAVESPEFESAKPEAELEQEHPLASSVVLDDEFW